MFENTIIVKGEEIDPLEELTQEEIPGKLEISLQDLRNLQREINKNRPNQIGQEFYFNIGSRTHLGHYLYTAEPSVRSAFSYNFFHEEPISFEQMIFGVKGTGALGWRDNCPEFIDNFNTRKYPVVINSGRAGDLFGGFKINEAKEEYLTSLILNKLIKRYNLPQSTYIPLAVMKPKSLVFLENGKLSKCSLEDYVDQNFHLKDSERYSNIKLCTQEDIENYGQLIYVGGLSNLRVFPKSLKLEHGHRVYGCGGLSYLGLSENEKTKLVNNFSNNLRTLVRLIHSYGGTFTTYPKGKDWTITSLASRNVSIDGVVFDMDELTFNPETQEQGYNGMKERDLKSCERVIENFTNMIGTTKEERERVYEENEKRRLEMHYAMIRNFNNAKS